MKKERLHFLVKIILSSIILINIYFLFLLISLVNTYSTETLVFTFLIRVIVLSTAAVALISNFKAKKYAIVTTLVVSFLEFLTGSVLIRMLSTLLLLISAAILYLSSSKKNFNHEKK